jgi:tetratricopeptide (TPR) repeat protein
VLPLVLGGAGLLGEYVWRRTVAAERMFASAEASMEAGQPAEALRLCGEVLSARPGLVDARFTAAMLGAWASIPKEEGLRSLEHAPEDETPDFARKYEAFAWVLRRSGEVEPSFRYLRLAMDKLRDAGRSLPPSLVWSAAEAAVLLGSEGENAIIRGTADGGRALWREVEGLLPPGAERDIARAWVEALDAGREPYLRAELLWLDGRWEPAWSTFEAALRLTPDGLPNGDRRVWAYRALGDGRWTLAAALSTAHPGADDETRRADAVARLIALAATGKVEEARRGMPELLRSASGAEERAKLRLLLARALMREHLDPEWTGALLSEAAAELMDPNDPDILLLNASAAKPGPFEEALSLSWDPRTGRLFRGALRRAGPTPSHLVSGTEYTRVNRPPSGGPWFFGPAWSPVTGGSLPVRYHPGR